MTNKEAIKWLNEAEILDLTRGNTKDRQAINTAISALWKQIPKNPEDLQPVKNAAGHTFSKSGKCPCCGETVEYYCNSWVCDFCGQAIDWADNYNG